LEPKDFARNAAEIVGDINYVHPFREGNRRTQLQFMRLLGERAGHTVNPDILDTKAWQSASIDAFDAIYEPMANAILQQAMKIEEGDGGAGVNLMDFIEARDSFGI